MIKNLLSITLVALALISFRPETNSPKLTSGTLVYGLKLENPAPEQRMMAALMPRTMTLKFNPSYTSMYFAVAVGNIKTVVDNSSGESTMMMNMFGKKTYTVMKPEDMEAESQPTPDSAATNPYKITYLEETKKIEGISCKKAIITDDEEQITSVWYTTELDLKILELDFLPEELKEVKGMPMEVIAKDGESTFKMYVKSIDDEAVPDSEFAVPEDYEQVKPEDLPSQFGGMNGSGN